MDTGLVTKAEFRAELDRMAANLDALRAENDALRSRLAQLASPSDSAGGAGATGAVDRKSGRRGDAGFDNGSRSGRVSRRRLFRRFGQVATAAGGVAVAGALFPAAAEAAPGDNVVLGQDNDTGAQTTGIVRTTGSSVTSPTLKVASDSQGAAIEVTGEVGLWATGLIGVMANGTETGLDAQGPIAITATGSKFGLIAKGNQAPLVLTAGFAGAPTGPHSFGEVGLDTSGNIWVCVLAGTPGDWRRLRTAVTGYDRKLPTSIGSSGLIHLMAKPFRLFDSRPGAAAPLTSGSKIAPGSPQLIQVVGTAPLGGGPFVPSTSVGALITITVTQTELSGYLKAYPSGSATVPDTSVLNWTATNQTIATTTIVNQNVYGNITIDAYNHPTHVIVDVIGFLA
jgi:hypothetical protein